jgi:hypothetical protein
LGAREIATGDGQWEVRVPLPQQGAGVGTSLAGTAEDQYGLHLSCFLS